MGAHTSVSLPDGRVVRVRFTDASDGDFRVIDPTAGLVERRQAVVGAPWSWLIQVHGDTVHRVDHPGQHAGAEGDGLLTTRSDCPISVTTADCAPVVLVAEGGVACVHAGWRGLVAGIIEEASSQLIATAGRPLGALLGPCIGPGSYEFGAGDLATVVDRYGPDVAGLTDDGAPALDMAAGVVEACRRAGWPEPAQPSCTSDRRWFSHRVRGDRARQAAVAWIEHEHTSGGAGHG